MKTNESTLQSSSGVLYVVSTPIGNLGDLSSRAVEVLQSVDAILCEDTRTFEKLAVRFAIKKPRYSYHEHNEQRVSREILERLQSGAKFALVSDAGTPGISDPGYRIVSAARAAGIPVSPIPGPSAVLAALSVSGLPIDRFYFEGFLPNKPGKREKRLQYILQMNLTTVVFESPQRIVRLLTELAALAPSRPVVLAREVTKLHEEFLRGTTTELAQLLAERPAIKGEIVLIIGRDIEAEQLEQD